VFEHVAQADPIAVPAQAEQIVPTVVQVIPPHVMPDHRFGGEVAAHVTMLVETFLADLPGVVPEVLGAPPNPGLMQVLPGPDDPWQVWVTLDVQGPQLAVELTSCGPLRPSCVSHIELGERILPNVPVGRAVLAVAQELERVLPFTESAWLQYETQDGYAALMTGRAAQALYGWTEPVPPEWQGNPRRDPIARAVYLDPGQASAWSVVGRTTPLDERRVMAWRLAAEARPESAALRAGYAAALDMTTQHRAAWTVWQEVARLAPGDRRFMVPRAAAALAAGEPEQALAVLDEVDEQFDYHPAIARLDTRVADALGEADDTLLKRWQEADRGNAEPVRRRIERFVSARQIASALSLTSELALRG
jgi:hypothetical protein